VKEIKLTKGYVTIVDDDTYKWAKMLKWQAREVTNGVYAVHGQRSLKNVHLHRLILGAQPGELVDHIDGNGLNNLMSNLRICTNAQNQRNQRPQKGGTSIYKGVYWRKDNKKWMAYIQFDRERTHLGCFNSELDAAVAYDKKARELFGEFARTNFL